MLTLWRKDTEWCETGFPQYAGPVETHWHAAARSWLGMFLIQDYRGWKGQRRRLAYRGCWTMAPRSCSVASKSCSKTQNSRMCYVILRTNCIRMKMGRIGNMMRCRVQIGGGICRCVDLSSCPPTKLISQDSVVTRLHGWCIWALEISKKRNAISQQLGQWYYCGAHTGLQTWMLFQEKAGGRRLPFVSWVHAHAAETIGTVHINAVGSSLDERFHLDNLPYFVGVHHRLPRAILVACCKENACPTCLGPKSPSTPSGPTSHTATSFLAWRWTFSTNSIKGSSRIISWIGQLKRWVVEAMKWTRGFVTSLLFIKARLLKSASRNAHKIPLPGKVM